MTDLMLPATQDAGLEPFSKHPKHVPLTPDLHFSQTLAATTWKMLAPLMAAQPLMRLWNPGVRFNESADLTKALPVKPAAVPLFWMNRTRLIALDLDAKVFGPQAVREDLAALRTLLACCDITFVVDVSTSGGAHVLIPLQIALTKDELVPLLAALAVRYRTLDLAPMQNDSDFGCITVPGSRCRDGGFRVLDGSMATAGEAFRVPNGPECLHRLAAELGVDDIAAGTTTAGPSIDEVHDVDEYVLGAGSRRTLRPPFQLTSEIPAAVALFSATGELAAGMPWPSPSEARLSVLYHAAGRGMCLQDVLARLAPGGAWDQGLARVYHRYRHDHAILRALQKDWDKAFYLHVQRCRSFRARTHKTLHTGVPIASVPHERWLAHAIWWCDTTLRSDPRRWSVAALLQAVAAHSARSGEIVNGTPTMAVGVRSLSLAMGLLSKETAASGLQVLREYPGSPLLRIQTGEWLIPDGYALVTPDVEDPEPTGPGRPQLVAVHDAWWVIGHHHRRVYETLQAFGSCSAAEVAASARMSLSAVYDSLNELCRRGVAVKCGKAYRVGASTLDDIARQWRVSDERARRIALYRTERRQWRQFLNGRRVNPVVEVQDEFGDEPLMDLALSPWEERDYLNAVMATGPPVADEELVVSVLGARRSRRWWWTDTNPW